jgi:hypothetical protein
VVHAPGDTELPGCAAAMLTNTQPAKSRTRLPLHDMLRRPMLHALHSLPRLRVRLWTWPNVMRMQATIAGNNDRHCTEHTDHRDGNDSDHHGHGKSHASARRATPALHHASVAPMPALVQPPQPVPLAELAASAAEMQALKFGREEESGRGGGCGERRRQRGRWMGDEGEGQGGTALHAGV